MVIYTKNTKPAKKTETVKQTHDPRISVSFKRLQQLKKIAKREKVTVRVLVERIMAESTIL